MKAADMFSLKDRVALVTGASSGLGVQFARALADNGAAVALVARRADRLAALQGEIEGKGGRAVAIEADVTTMDLGGERTATARVVLGDLSPDDVQVQLLHGPVGQNDEIDHSHLVVMTGDGDRFSGTFRCEHPGRYGFTVRVVPNHPDLVSPVELGLVAWA